MITSWPRSSSFSFCVLLVCLLLACSVTSICGQNREQIRLADSYFQNGYFEKAIPLYQAHTEQRTRDFASMLKLAICQYEVNDLNHSIANLNTILQNDRNPDNETFFHLARAYHQKHNFDQAIRYYKEFVSNTETGLLRALAIDEIKRSAVGLRYHHVDNDVLVENLGSDVNSDFEDFQPIESPNHPFKIYFSSIRNATIVDEFSADGNLQGTNAGRDCDMYATEIVNGSWSAVTEMNPELNTGQHEILQHFSADGMVVYFSRSHTIQQTELQVDTFTEEGSKGSGGPWANPPFGTNAVIRGMQFWSDSLIIYAANLQGDQDGFDLYYVRSTKGEWQDPVAFPIQKQGSFDRVSPFLARDGRTLYFSSNDLQSMGGFDVFRSVFDDETMKWSDPENLGRPINSAGDDLFYRLSRNGSLAYFSSNRKSGQGCQDIYSSYFKDLRREQTRLSIPSLFYDVEEFRLFSESMVASGNEPEKAVYEFPVLFYRDDQIMTPQNQSKLRDLAAFLNNYPHVYLEITCHSDQLDVSNFDLFFSIRRSEEVASRLVEEGIEPDRLYLRGVGGNYPIARGNNSKIMETAQFLNRRIDIRIINPNQLPVSIRYDLPKVSETLQTGFVEGYYQKLKGLTYKIQFAATDQLFKGDLIGQYPDPSVEKNPDSDLYFYCSGIFSSFEAALQHLTTIKTKGYAEANIIPYLDGIRLSNGEMETELLNKFPDLKNYILYLE